MAGLHRGERGIRPRSRDWIEIPAPARRDAGRRSTPCLRPLRPSRVASPHTAACDVLQHRQQQDDDGHCTVVPLQPVPPLPQSRHWAAIPAVASRPSADSRARSRLSASIDPCTITRSSTVTVGLSPLALRSSARPGSEVASRMQSAAAPTAIVIRGPLVRADDDASASRAADLYGGLPAVPSGLRLYMGPNFSSGRACRRRDKSSGRTRMWRATHTPRRGRRGSWLTNTTRARHSIDGISSRLLAPD